MKSEKVGKKSNCHQLVSDNLLDKLGMVVIINRKYVKDKDAMICATPIVQQLEEIRNYYTPDKTVACYDLEDGRFKELSRIAEKTDRPEFEGKTKPLNDGR